MKTENEKETEIEREETKRRVVEKYLEECGTTIYHLKERIAQMSIDYTGTLEVSYSLLLRVRRKWDAISLEYYQHGEDGYTNHNRFWYEFSIYFFRDLPSGYNVRKTGDEYEILDGNKVMGKISGEDLQNELIDDLVVWDEGRFNEEFEEFMNELYEWILEVN